MQVINGKVTITKGHRKHKVKITLPLLRNYQTVQAQRSWSQRLPIHFLGLTPSHSSKAEIHSASLRCCHPGNGSPKHLLTQPAEGYGNVVIVGEVHSC